MAVRYVDPFWTGRVVALYFVAGAVLVFGVVLLDQIPSLRSLPGSLGSHLEIWALALGFAAVHACLAVVHSRQTCVLAGAVAGVLGFGLALLALHLVFGEPLQSAIQYVAEILASPLMWVVFLVGPLLGSLVVWLISPWRRVGHRPRGECPACGYSLKGLTSDKCPECGKPIDRTYWPVGPFKNEEESGRGEPG